MSEQILELKKRRIKRGWMRLKIQRIFSDNEGTKTLYFVDEEEGNCAFDYLPGQYLTFRFDSLAEKPIVRSYTMSSSPCQKEAIAVTVREVEDPFVSRYLCRECQVGDVLRARGPIGRFVFDPKKDHSHLVMVAGGSGVTPFVSIMREHAKTLGELGSPKRMTLFVTFRSLNELMCWEALETLRHVEGVNLVVSLSREKSLLEDSCFFPGRMSLTLLDQQLGGDYSDTTFMTCGPEALMSSTVKHLKAQGVREEQIKLESFD